MSSTSETDVPCTQGPAITPRRASAGGQIQRIDGPHVASAAPPEEHAAGPSAFDPGDHFDEPDPPPELLAALIGQLPELAREQLELQAAELGDHLRERLREVDRREAQVNARIAQLEADQRAARLWLREREEQFLEREAELQRQIEDARDTSAELSHSADDAVAFEARQQELLAREHQHQLKENDLRERRLAIEREAAALRHAQQIWQQERARQEAELARHRDRLNREYEAKTADRDQTLAGAESLLSEHIRQLERDRQALLDDRRAWTEEQAAQRSQLDQHKLAIQAQLDDRSARLDARQQWVERQKAGLEQVRGEILAHHRQALEMRLIAEQLWSQSCGRMTPAEVTQSIAQLRLKLAEQYKLEEAELGERKRELVALGERVAEQHRGLKQLQTGIREWATARQAEIEQDAERLVRRELALDEQQQTIAAAQHRWQAERRHYEQQIRQIQQDLRAAHA